VSSFSVIWLPENSISAELCNPRIKGSKLLLSSFSAFRDLQMLFLPGRRSYDSNLPSFLWDHFLHFGGQKCFFSRVADHTVQGYLDPCELIFYSLASWKSDFWQVKSTIKCYLASRELFFGILAAWKSLFCEVVKTIQPDASTFTKYSNSTCISSNCNMSPSRIIGK